jgi:hypothetical protein
MHKTYNAFNSFVFNPFNPFKNIRGCLPAEKSSRFPHIQGDLLMDVEHMIALLGLAIS